MAATATATVYGFPPELCREAKPSRRESDHIVRGGLAYTARRGVARPARDVDSSAETTPGISRASSRELLGESSSFGPSSSLTMGAAAATDKEPSRLAALYDAAAHTVSALLVPKQSAGVRLRSPANASGQAGLG